MHIGGLIPCSFIDFPSKLAAVLFTVGCNFKCSYCYNPNLSSPGNKAPVKLDVAKVFDFLRKRKNLLDGVVITGGEPTLQQGLIPFLNWLKSTGYLVKLDTNGSNPGVLSKAINKKLLDYIAMDIKVPVNEYEKFLKGTNVSCNDILNSIKLIKNSGIEHEFRTTTIKPFHTIDDLVEIGKVVGGGKHTTFVLQKFINDRPLMDPKFANTSEPFTEEELESVRAQLTKKKINCIIR